MGKLWQFIKKVMNGTTVQLSKRLPEALEAPNLYLSINDLLLSAFILCYTDHNLSVLIKSGTATQEQLESAWDGIYEEYVYAIGDNENKLYLRLYKELCELVTRIHLIRRLIEILYNYRVKKFEDILNKELGTNFKFNSKNPEEYDKMLQKCYNKSKALVIRHDLKEIELKSIEKGQKKKNQGQKPTKEYFSGILNALSSIHKYRILANQITTFEYIDLIRLTNKMTENNGRRT
jgi:hypothetical protein